jgi:hypothetical protein
VYLNLAIRISAGKGKGLAAVTKKIAREAYDALLWAAAAPQEQQLARNDAVRRRQQELAVHQREPVLPRARPRTARHWLGRRPHLQRDLTHEFNRSPAARLDADHRRPGRALLEHPTATTAGRRSARCSPSCSSSSAAGALITQYAAPNLTGFNIVFAR